MAVLAKILTRILTEILPLSQPSLFVLFLVSSSIDCVQCPELTLSPLPEQIPIVEVFSQCTAFWAVSGAYMLYSLYNVMHSVPYFLCSFDFTGDFQTLSMSGYICPASCFVPEFFTAFENISEISETVKSGVKNTIVKLHNLGKVSVSDGQGRG